MKPDFGSIFTPFFWITITFLAITYGPVLAGRLKGDIKSAEIKQQIIDRSPQPIKLILGDQTQSPDDTFISQSVKPAGQISTYVKNVIDDATKAVIDKGSFQLEETKQQTTSLVCKQIITEVQKQCGIEQ
ncbi:hypothetical protein HYU89_04205 [Candidatus Collierbacteria bacterium]|nr:hypothetical protein [Candidatus Collierbacteria bacterium]